MDPERVRDRLALAGVAEPLPEGRFEIRSRRLASNALQRGEQPSSELACELRIGAEEECDVVVIGIGQRSRLHQRAPCEPVERPCPREAAPRVGDRQRRTQRELDFPPARPQRPAGGGTPVSRGTRRDRCGGSRSADEAPQARPRGARAPRWGARASP